MKAAALIVVVISLFLPLLKGQPPRLMLPVGHLSGVSGAAFSPDGKYIVTASHDFTAKVWSVAGGQLLLDLDGHLSDVNSAVFSPDGKKILTASNDRTARVWNALTGELIFTLAGHRTPVLNAVYSPDGKSIVTISEEATAKIWNALTGKLTCELKGHRAEINSAEFSPDSRSIVTASNDFTAKIWNASTGKLLFDLKGHRQDVVIAAFSPDAGTIVTASKDHTARTWNAKTGQLLLQLQAGHRMLNTAAFSPDGRLLVTTSDDSTARLWDWHMGTLQKTLRSPSCNMDIARFSPDGKTLVTAPSLDCIKAEVWDVASGQWRFDLTGHHNILRSIAFSPNGRLVSTASDDRTAKVWNIITGQLSMDLEGHSSQLDNTAFSPGGHMVVTSTRNNRDQLWYASNGRQVPGMNRFVNFSEDGKWIASLSWDDDGLKIWNATKGQLVNNLGLFSIYPDLTSFSPDGRYLLTASDTTMRIWEIATGRQVAGMNAIIDIGHHPSFSLDGRWVMTNLNDSTINIWNATNGELKGNYITNAAEFSPDGRFLATTSEDHTINLWNLLSGAQTANFPGDGGKFSPDGNLFIVRKFDENGNYGEPTIRNSQDGKLMYAGAAGPGGFADFSEEGRFLFTSTNTGNARIWDLAHSKLHSSFNVGTGELGSAIFSRDGAAILTTSIDRTIRLWNCSTAQLIANLGRFPLLAYYPRFSPDNKWIIIRYSDSNWVNRIKGWNKTAIFNAANGSLVKTIGAERNEDFEDIDLVNNRLTSRKNSEAGVYDLFSGKKIYSILAVDSTDYLNRIPSGYYTSTPDAARLLHYVTPDLRVITFDQLDLKYNRPDKVLEAMAYPDTALINSYRNVYYKRIRRLNIDTSSFRDGYSVPESDFVNRDSIAYEQENGSLRVHIRGSDSAFLLDRFNIWMNQVPVFGTRGINIRPHLSKTFDTLVNLRLSEGTNAIEASVTNVNGTESYRLPLLVNYTPAQVANKQTYFIGIGIQQFADSKHNLQWSVKDIRDLALGLKGKYQDRIEIDTLFDQDVTVGNIKTLKRKLLNASVNDKLIIAYSGHGLLSRTYDYYLSTYNINFDHPEQNGLAYDELDNLMDSIPPRRKLLLIDACHSGELDKEEMEQYAKSQKILDSTGIHKGVVLISKDSSRLGMKGSMELMEELFVNVGKSTGATVISAAAGTQFALEKNNLRNGVFTYSLLEYLQQHEHATIRELKQYVNQRVKQLTAGLQVPTARNENIILNWEVW